MTENVNPIPTGKIEIAGLAGLLAGLIMKFMHVPFSGPTIVISLGTLGVVYAIGAFEIVSIEQEEKPHTALNILTGILLAIACIGILFRLMYWPFSQPYLSIATLGLPVVFCWMFTVRSKVVFEETAKKYLSKLMRITLFFALAATLYSMSLKTQIDLENWDDAEMARLKYKWMSDQTNADYKKEYLEYRKKKYNN